MGTSLEQKMVNYIFFESASGFGLFERTESEDIGKLTEEVQNSVLEMKRFGKIMRLASFLPFTSAENALLCQNEISEGVLPEIALNFLSTSLQIFGKQSFNRIQDRFIQRRANHSVR